MGCERVYPEEGPVYTVAVDGFWIDPGPVTVAEFARFAIATDYVTLAEREPDPAEYPEVDPRLLVPGSLVFQPTSGPVPLTDFRAWWAYVPGANWKHPEGPGSDLKGRGRHPVVHVAYADVEAYAQWAGKQIPTEAEWERAARGGLEGAEFCWGDSFTVDGQQMANTWQGEFPWQNLKPPRKRGTSPVRSFQPNAFGLYDMAGNVWEWTSDYFAAQPAHQGCCAPPDPRGVTAEASVVHDQAGAGIPRRVIKGGSHLCAPNYCLRYRPAARQAEDIDTSTQHIGFRCILRAG